MKRTAEYVSLGHPDKTADYISSYILDRMLAQDPDVKYAVEVMIKGNTVVLGGEIAGNVELTDINEFVKNDLRDIGYDEAYANAYFVNANSTTAPGIVDADRNPILVRSEVYSGVYGRASINFYAFNSNGNRGIACGLNNLQKIRDGEPLGGKASAESDFDTDDDDDFLA